MPTAYPPDVKPAASAAEEADRTNAVTFIKKLHDTLYGYAYSTRSHIPGVRDFTEFINAVHQMHDFCKARPDWTVDIVKETIRGYDAAKRSGGHDLFALEETDRIKALRRENDTDKLNLDCLRRDVERHEANLKKIASAVGVSQDYVRVDEIIGKVTTMAADLREARAAAPIDGATIEARLAAVEKRLSGGM